MQGDRVCVRVKKEHCESACDTSSTSDISSVVFLCNNLKMYS